MSHPWGASYISKRSPSGRVLRFSLRDSRTGSFSLGEVSANGSDLHPLLKERKPDAGWLEGELRGLDTRRKLFSVYFHKARTANAAGEAPPLSQPWPRGSSQEFVSSERKEAVRGLLPRPQPFAPREPSDRLHPRSIVLILQA